MKWLMLAGLMVLGACVSSGASDRIEGCWAQKGDIYAEVTYARPVGGNMWIHGRVVNQGEDAIRFCAVEVGVYVGMSGDVSIAVDGAKMDQAVDVTGHIAPGGVWLFSDIVKRPVGDFGLRIESIDAVR